MNDSIPQIAVNSISLVSNLAVMSAKDFVDEQASTAIDDVSEDREAAIRACRDRALVYLLSYSGVRGAEILRDRSDERRQGLRWDDVHLEDRYATVFAKKQRLDDRGFLSQ